MSGIFESGRVYGLIGQNGAGKTVLLKVLAGIYSFDQGTVEITGIPYAPLSPRDAMSSGVAYVPQIPYIPTNLTVGDLQRLAGLSLNAEVASVPDPQLSLSELGVVERQLLELHLAVSRRPTLLLLDEPRFLGVSAYADRWRDLISSAQRRGTTILIVSHNLAATANACDEILLLERGSITRHFQRGDALEDALPRTLDADPLNAIPPPPTRPTKVFRLTLSVGSLDLGYPGLTCVYGGNSPHWSRFLDSLSNSIDKKRNSIGIVTKVPGHRSDRGLALSATVRDNLLLATRLRASGVRRWIPSTSAVNAAAWNAIDNFGVTPKNITIETRTLSGGNKQRLAFARAFLPKPDCVAVTNPWRGLDRNGEQLVARKLAAHLAGGGGVLIATDDAFEFAYWRRWGAPYELTESGLTKVNGSAPKND